ncbi:MAG: competence ComEA-like helix-hairpin-helix protein [Planctomycetota bacterium]
MLLMAWAFLVQLLAVRAFAGGLLPAPPSVVITPCRIDVNGAGVAELQALPSVGPSRAEALVLERIRHGPFDGLADLSRVRGFGPEMLARLAEFVQFAPESAR